MTRLSFHHGDLRNSIIAATLRLIEAKGIQGFTLSDAAREAGVAKSAPYRHFESKQAILVAVAVDCFGRFHGQLARAAERPDPEDALQGMLRAYFDTALHHPAEFRAMFASGIDKAADAELSVVAERCFHQLTAAVARCLGRGERSKVVPDPVPITLQLWVAVHGVAVLALDGSLRKLGGTPRIHKLLLDLQKAHLP